MLDIKNLINLLILGKSASRLVQIRTILSAAATIMKLCIAAGGIIGAVVVYGFFTLYHTLITSGFGFPTAIISVGACLFIGLALLMIVITYYVRRLGDRMLLLLQMVGHASSFLYSMISSFLGGVLTPPVPKK